MSDSTEKFLIGFVLAILGTILVGVIASQILLTTNYASVVDESVAFTANATLDGVNVSESYQVTNYPTGWKLDDCPLSSVTIRNATAGTALTEDTDYTVALGNGSFTFIDTPTTAALVGADNSSYVTYLYCADGYLNSSWGRTVLNLAPGIFVVMILLAIVALLYTFLRIGR